jgi:nitrite reductase/ring-hydroxylating ferredoxin subunit
MVYLDNAHPAFRAFWHPVAASDEIGASPTKVSLGGESWVLWRGSDGAVHALGDRCPHREAPLSQGTCQGDVIRCPYHGWEFAADGRCLTVPAVAPGTLLPERFNALAPHGVEERYGLVWLAPEAPKVDLPELPEWGSASPITQALAPRRIACSAAQLAENFVDLAHFPYLHGTTFADPDPVVIPLVDIEVRPSGFRWEFQDKFRIVGSADFDPVVTEFIYTAPYWVTATTFHPETGASETIVTVAQPETLDTSRLFVIMLHNGIDFPQGDVDARMKFWDQVMYEDCWLLETMERKGLELSLATKASSAADRCSVELHRQLAAIANAA